MGRSYCAGSPGEGMLGQMGLTICKGGLLASSWESCAVLGVVFSVLTCHSVNPLDLGKYGDEVTWSMWLCWTNCESSSDAKGRLLSV